MVLSQSLKPLTKYRTKGKYELRGFLWSFVILAVLHFSWASLSVLCRCLKDLAVEGLVPAVGSVRQLQNEAEVANSHSLRTAEESCVSLSSLLQVHPSKDGHLCELHITGYDSINSGWIHGDCFIKCPSKVADKCLGLSQFEGLPFVLCLCLPSVNTLPQGLFEVQSLFTRALLWKCYVINMDFLLTRKKFSPSDAVC